MKRENDISTLNEVIGRMIEGYDLTEKFSEKKIIAVWGEVFGVAIKNRTKNIYIKNKILFVEFSSSALKHEMSLSKEKVMKKLFKKIGDNSFEDIKFV